MNTQSEFHKHIFQDKQAASDQEQQSSSIPNRLAWWLGGDAALSYPSRVASATWMSQAMPRMAGAPVTLEDRRLMRALKERARNSGVGVFSPSAKPSATGFKGLVEKFFTPRPSSNFMPLTHSVFLNKGTRGPGMLAHELGHAEGSAKLITGNLKGRYWLPWFTMGALASDSPTTGRNWALASMIPAAGVMASELDASRRGYRMMRDLGAGRMKSLTSFSGIPTYVLSSSIPTLSYWLKRSAGGYHEPKH